MKQAFRIILISLGFGLQGWLIWGKATGYHRLPWWVSLLPVEAALALLILGFVIFVATMPKRQE